MRYCNSTEDEECKNANSSVNINLQNIHRKMKNVKMPSDARTYPTCVRFYVTRRFGDKNIFNLE